MKLSMDIRKMTKRDIAVVTVGSLIFFGLLYFLSAGGYVGTLALIAMVLYFIGRRSLWKKGR